jgi:hypothetical protein
MEIPLDAQVECTDGVGGSSVYVLINPVIENVTHLVVRADSSPHAEYIVPVDLISATVAGSIQLRCSKAELEKMDPFIQKSFIQEKVPDYVGNQENGMGGSFYWPYVVPDVTVYESVENQQIPDHEMAVSRGTPVEASDGPIGHVDEFLVNPENGKITHLVLREGHLWGQKDVIIPLSAIRESRKDTVYLNLDKHEVESLPAFSLHRHWA